MMSSPQANLEVVSPECFYENHTGCDGVICTCECHIAPIVDIEFSLCDGLTIGDDLK